MGARNMFTRDMRVAGMGAYGGRHKLDGDHNDRPPDQSCQPSPPAHDID
jgi:hypothetical protein